MAPLLRGDVNPDPSSFYPIPGAGVNVDNVLPTVCILYYIISIHILLLLI